MKSIAYAVGHTLFLEISDFQIVNSYVGFNNILTYI